MGADGANHTQFTREEFVEYLLAKLPEGRIPANYGIVVSMGHSNATYSEAEAGFQAGAKSITHLFNAMRPFHHREPGIAGFGLMNRHIYVEVIADPFHLHRI